MKRSPAAALASRLAAAGPRGLLAYPAQSNFSGVRHPLAWVAEAKALGWDVLLDAAAFVPTSRLDLRETPADFVSLSFYKMFGYPTGVGCLLARREALAALRRPRSLNSLRSASMDDSRRRSLRGSSPTTRSAVASRTPARGGRAAKRAGARGETL